MIGHYATGLPPLDKDAAESLLQDGTAQYDWYLKQTETAEGKLARAIRRGTVLGLIAAALSAFPITSGLNLILGAAVKPAEVAARAAEIDVTRWVVAALALMGTLFSSNIASRWRRIAIDREKGRLATALAVTAFRTKLLYTSMDQLEFGKLVGLFQTELVRIDSVHGSFEGADVGGGGPPPSAASATDA